MADGRSTWLDVRRPRTEGTPAPDVFSDDRGQLVAVELAHVPFEPQRCFVVTGTQGPASRGGHVAGCREYMVLISGLVRLHLDSASRGSRQLLLDSPGDVALIDADDLVCYDLLEPGTSVLVLADVPYDVVAQPERTPNQ